jgi:hypothetical protein
MQKKVLGITGHGDPLALNTIRGGRHAGQP